MLQLEIGKRKQKKSSGSKVFNVGTFNESILGEFFLCLIYLTVQLRIAEPTGVEIVEEAFALRFRCASRSTRDSCRLRVQGIVIDAELVNAGCALVN